MPKQIILLMEGTGNTHVAPSNVTRMLEFCALSPATAQVAIWDSGVGTRMPEDAEVFERELRKHTGCEESQLTVLAATRHSRWTPWWWAWAKGSAFGCGLERNVAEAVEALARKYQPGDDFYLFGFSRGAFSVRVVAALLYRFGLPPSDCSDTHGWVTAHLRTMERDGAIDHSGVTPVRTHFLGLWDTVKSYGFLRPVRYHHLRHNGGVQHVRHALALDENRSYFQCTTWGGLDRDRDQKDANRPHGLRQRPVVNPHQTVTEMWFRGSHTDVGGGDRERGNAEIALRWMLREAQTAGLVLNLKGQRFLEQPDPDHPIVPTRRRWRSRVGYWVTDHLPRWEPDNAYSPAKLRFVWRPTGARDPRDYLRDGRYALHPSAQDASYPRAEAPAGFQRKGRLTSGEDC